MSKNKETLSSKPKNSVLAKNDDDIDEGLIKAFILGSAFFTVLAAILFDKTKDLSGLRFVIFGTGVVVFILSYFLYTNKLKTRNIISLIFAEGYVIRLNYVLITSVVHKVRQHDLYYFGDGQGHSGYIEHFYKNGFTLPFFNPTLKPQFYHPPLNHFLMALWARLLTTFGMSYDRAIASLPFLTLFYSMLTLITCERILHELKLKGKGKIIPLTILAVHPTMLLFSGSINNDNLSFLLTLLTFYTALRWYREPTMRNIIYIAVSLGFGMSTKLSVALIAPALVILFVYRFVHDDNRVKKYFYQFLEFLGVSVPLGMWYYLRNAVKYDIPITYVPKLRDTSDQYVGFYSVSERLFDFSKHPFDNVFLNQAAAGKGEYFEYNPFVTIIKTSLYGEYNYRTLFLYAEVICRILLIVNIALIALSLVAMCYCFVRNSSFIDSIQKMFIYVFYVIVMASYFGFVFKYPHNCSMDYRYLPVTMVIGSAFIGMFTEQIKIDFPKKQKFTNIFQNIVVGISAVFAVLSGYVYVMIGS